MPVVLDHRTTNDMEEFEGPLSMSEDESESENENANAGNDSGTTSSRKIRDMFTDPPRTRNRNRNRLAFTILAVANPRIRFLQPGTAINQPEHVCTIWRNLSAGSGLHFIPRAFEVSSYQPQSTFLANF